MNDDQLDDLKQFIDSKISQSEARLGNKLDGVDDKLTKKIEGLEQKVDNGFAGVGDAIEEINHHVTDLDIRVTKLEQTA